MNTIMWYNREELFCSIYYLDWTEQGPIKTVNYTVNLWYLYGLGGTCSHGCSICVLQWIKMLIKCVVNLKKQLHASLNFIFLKADLCIFLVGQTFIIIFEVLLFIQLIWF